MSDFLHIFLPFLFILTGIGMESWLIYSFFIINSCKVEVDATLLDVDRSGMLMAGNRSGNVAYTPTFKYKYNHCWYTSRSKRDFLRYSEASKYKKGRRYKIFINARDPKMCIPSRFKTETLINMAILLLGGIGEIVLGFIVLL